MNSKVEENIRQVEALFMETGVQAREIIDLTRLLRYLDSIPGEFRSIAYESASMEIASMGLTGEESLDHWLQFYEKARKMHRFHVQIGLGWAFGKSEASVEHYGDVLPDEMEPLIMNGMGYFYALFKGRRTLKMKEVPEHVSNNQLNWFDHGVGRRIWYHTKGDPDAVKRMVDPFDQDRHKAIWKGVGIAMAYVGGGGEGYLASLKERSGEFAQYLGQGVVLAALSRSEAEDDTEGVKNACKYICGDEFDKVVKQNAYSGKDLVS